MYQIYEKTREKRKKEKKYMPGSWNLVMYSVLIKSRLLAEKLLSFIFFTEAL